MEAGWCEEDKMVNNVVICALKYILFVFLTSKYIYFLKGTACRIWWRQHGGLREEDPLPMWI